MGLSPRQTHLLVIPYSDIMARDAEGLPGNVEPAVAGQELVGKLVSFQKIDQAFELGGILRTDVGSTALKVLRVFDPTYAAVHVGITKAGVNDDGTADSLAGGLKQITATINHVCNLLNGGIVLGVLLPIAEFCQSKMHSQNSIVHNRSFLNGEYLNV